MSSEKKEETKVSHSDSESEEESDVSEYESGEDVETLLNNENYKILSSVFETEECENIAHIVDKHLSGIHEQQKIKTKNIIAIRKDIHELTGIMKQLIQAFLVGQKEQEKASS